MEGGGVQLEDVHTKMQPDALLRGNLHVLSLQSTTNIQTATTLKCNNFENYNIRFFYLVIMVLITWNSKRTQEQ